METASLAVALVASVVSGLGSPENILGGLMLGWFCRRWWQVVAAAVAMRAVVLAILLPGSLPPGAEILWATLPLGVIGPLAWCAGGFVLRQYVVPRGSTAERVLSSAAAAVLGGAAGGALGALLGTLYVDLARVSSFEGQSGYLVLFLFVLPGILLGALVGAIVAWRLARR